MSRELLLLGLLRQQEMHGYRLNEFISRDLAACTDLKKATAYFVLGRMAEQGWVKQESEQQGKRPPRRVYQLTPAGEAAFQNLLRQELALHKATTLPGDAALALLDALPPAEALPLLAERRRQMADALEQAGQVPPHPGSLGLVVEHQARHLQTELDWLDTIIQRLESGL